MAAELTLIGLWFVVAGVMLGQCRFGLVVRCKLELPGKLGLLDKLGWPEWLDKLELSDRLGLSGKLEWWDKSGLLPPLPGGRRPSFQ